MPTKLGPRKRQQQRPNPPKPKTLHQHYSHNTNPGLFKKEFDDPHPRSSNGRTPRTRQNNPESYGNPTMDRDATMDSRLRKRMHDLPAKQNHDPQKENTALPYHHQRRYPPIPTDCNGPYHRTSAATWAQCHPNHSRLRMFVRS